MPCTLLSNLLNGNVAVDFTFLFVAVIISCEQLVVHCHCPSCHHFRAMLPVGIYPNGLIRCIYFISLLPIVQNRDFFLIGCNTKVSLSPIVIGYMIGYLTSTAIPNKKHGSCLACVASVYVKSFSAFWSHIKSGTVHKLE